MKNPALLLCVFLLVAWYQGYPQQTVSDKGDRFSIEIPTEWVYASSKNPIVQVFMCSSTEYPTERLTITYSKGIGGLDKAYRESKTVSKDLKKFRIIQEGGEMLSGEECKWFVFTSENSDGDTWKGKRYTMKPNKVFIIQYFVPEKRFDAAKETFEQIISTFKLK